MGIGKFCHPIAKDIFTISRLVIVPEFQGFGLGFKFMDIVSELYSTYRIRITTSLKPFIIALSKNNKWKCVRMGRLGKSMGKLKINDSSQRITASFQMI